MKRGGCRHGAGRRPKRPRREECAVIDVRRLREIGALRDGDHGALKVGAGRRLWYRTSAGALRLSYEFGRPAFQVVEFESTAANLGIGTRPWLRCPREGCDRRCMLLYCPPGPDKGFACSRCTRITYPSQRLSDLDRAAACIRELRSRLGPDGERPRGMLARTHWRIRQAIAQAECDYAAVLAAWAAAAFPPPPSRVTSGRARTDPGSR